MPLVRFWVFAGYVTKKFVLTFFVLNCFIVKNYIKPNLQEKPIINEDDESEKIFKLLASYVNTPDNQNSVGVDEIFTIIMKMKMVLQ
jgi:hypothetical protein